MHPTTTATAGPEWVCPPEALFAALFEDGTEAMIITDQDGVVIRVNGRMLALAGRTAEQFLAVPIGELFAGEAVPDLMAAGLFSREPVAHGVWSLRRPDGGAVAVAPRVRKIDEGALLWVFSYLSSGSETERVVREREDRLRAIYNGVSAGISIVDLVTGRILDVNQGMCDMFACTLEEAIGMSLLDFSADAPPFGHAAVLDLIEKTTGGPQSLDWQVKDLHGRLFWVDASLRRARIAGVERLLIVARDVTERRQMEESLRFTQFSIDRVADNLLWLDDGATIIYANAAASASLGFTREELVGRKIHELDPDFPPEAWLPHIEELRRRGSITFESRRRRKDGSIFPVEVTGNYFEYNGRFFSLAFDRDITERKKVEEQLRQSERRFRTLLEDVPTIAIQGYRLDGTTTYWNQASERLYGFSPEEAIGRNLLDLIIPPAMQPVVKEEVQRMIDTGRVIPSDELLLQHKDGSLVPVYSNHALVGIPGEEPELFCLDLDLTERKRAEEEQQRLQAQLIQSQKMESVGRLAGGMAHDFNNMLTGILGHAQLARIRIDPTDPVNKDLLAIEDSALRSANLVRQLLAFARQQTVAPEVMDLNENSADMLRMLQRIIGEDIDLLWSPGPELWSIKIDPSQIDQILVNLCINARDAITGVGKITIETKNVAFDQEYCLYHRDFQPGEYVMLAVSDNGCGMDKEILDHLFEPFFTTKAFGQGTGLGLSTVYGIVKQNEGFVNVYSEPGSGSTFRVYFRRHSGVKPAAPAAPPQQMIKGQGESVLLVEDERVIMDVGKAILEALGYTVITAERPSDALLQAQKYRDEIKLLITDVVMPEMNGRDLAKLLAVIIPDIKCLFTSGYTANVIAHHGVLDEGVNFLQKPYSMTDMAFKVQEVLHRG